MTWLFTKKNAANISSEYVAKRQKTAHTQSIFCPYDDTSNAYDQTRVPLGVGCTLGTLALNDMPLGEQRLLDVGGGTGTFVGGTPRACMRARDRSRCRVIGIPARAPRLACELLTPPLGGGRPPRWLIPTVLAVFGSRDGVP